MKKVLISVLVLFLFGATLIFTASIYAADRIVNLTGDGGDGVCDATCTLRDAYTSAASGDRIVFDQSMFGSGGTITLANQITIAKNITIEQTSSTAPITINTEGARVFEISTGFNVTLIRLRITGGDNGDRGGGILNNGTLTINQSTISGNTASQGGGIFNNGGTLTLNRSTVSGNSAGGGGGGIYNFNGTSGNTATVTLTNSTISGNSGGSGFGGGYFGFSDLGTTTLNSTNGTIAKNSAFYGGGVAVSSISGATSNANLNNTIIGDNAANALAGDTDGPDIYTNPLLVLPPLIPGSTVIAVGTINSSGYNLIENTSGATVISTAPMTERTGDPKLIDLADNGFVFAPTHALTFEVGNVSPAIDAGNTVLTTDQRGLSRNVDQPNAPNPPDTDPKNDDIGAYEIQASTAALSFISGQIITNYKEPLPNLSVTVQNLETGEIFYTSTNEKGRFVFEGLETARMYQITVSSFLYTFTPYTQVFQLLDSMENVNFVAIRRNRKIKSPWHN